MTDKTTELHQEKSLKYKINTFQDSINKANKVRTEDRQVQHFNNERENEVMVLFDLYSTKIL